ncbi:MAG: Glu/Leu/Phe/Val dehydrogenase [Nanoarchaeota archaeon]|nr:Glu/Leu/Phe/Val dehydrogenase [Nanoarchaeota archaeon]
MVSYDGFGPEKILEVYNPRLGMRGVVVLDNLSLGPGKGGIRMTPSVSVDEVARLARAMTWKNALAELPFGGAKAGIIADPKKMSPQLKDAHIAAFAEAIKAVCPSQYVAGPDMNTTEHEMGVFVRANGNKKSATGKPSAMGGLPHELGSTGFGVYHATLQALAHKGLSPKRITFAVEGFGNVGVFAARYLSEAGAKCVAVSDSKGVIYNESGINIQKLEAAKDKSGTVTSYPGKILSNHDVVAVNADVLITAAIPDLIKMGDVDRMQAKILVEGSNIPTTPDVEEMLHRKGVLVVPDFVANAGGVISSYVEYIGKRKDFMFRMVEDKLVRNTKMVLDHAAKKGMKPRDAALVIAQERVLKECKICKI